VQLQLNVLDDASDALELAAAHDLGVLCRSPLAMGLLGGRYTADSLLPENDIRRVERLDQTRRALAALDGTIAHYSRQS
jgi:aryl-alcohol dehydrogenase-like predicted oxidoreductase